MSISQERKELLTWNKNIFRYFENFGLQNLYQTREWTFNEKYRVIGISSYKS